MKTPLCDLHEQLGARMVEFAGWDMPVHYGSQLEEHHAVRRHAGCFDVSHMAVVAIPTQPGEELLRQLLVGDVKNLEIGRGLYTLMLNDRGGIVDDLIVYRGSTEFRLVVNAGTTQKDLAWIEQHALALGCGGIANHHSDLCIIAVQGPTAIGLVGDALAVPSLGDIAPFSFVEHREHFIARTGYTGEDGVEIICRPLEARDLWQQLTAAGVVAAGLGARDSLRLEAGLNLYGHDMTEETNPFECRVAWTIDWEDASRPFIGRDAVEKLLHAGSPTKLVGVRLTERGIPREGCEVHSAAGTGVVTSGTFSPTLQYGIALARVPRQMRGPCQIQVRKRLIDGRTVRLPFVKREQ
ncbi:MAG: glycine cleavage system aminomethyltransferase GcvT [Gammaproteobacteria bacterium]|nr:glycine cleavage system aminomethyltransferase GcvT [Gammaproteobacteria bacterium]